MKALKDCKWLVVIQWDGTFHYWKARTKDYTVNIFFSKAFKISKSALKNWEKFAELNGITNYKIME